MSSGRLPKVSVAIPVYNGQAYLAATIHSVLAQTCTDFELIICDDASRDGSLDVAASYPDPRIRILRNEKNLGFGGNWNRCLNEAQGTYIKILPQDDLLHPGCLQSQVDAFERDEKGALALVYCARQIIGPSGRVHMRRSAGRSTRISTGADIARRTARLGTNPIGEPGAVLFRRSAARAAGAFNGELPFVIDIDYWLRLLRFGDALYMPDALASFRLSRGSHSVQMARRQADEFRLFLSHLAESGHYGLRWSDLKLGGYTATLNGVARAIFYRFAVGGRS
ncbi:glycosyltransferase family 2 protein [Aestuariivirga sp.]|uniref:glycosyltransferase family 2 protein n=1 Tax=Aestuariivirga sp. TaxID=2650926 RepID=UPI003BACC82C